MPCNSPKLRTTVLPHNAGAVCVCTWLLPSTRARAGARPCAHTHAHTHAPHTQFYSGGPCAQVTPAPCFPLPPISPRSLNSCPVPPGPSSLLPAEIGLLTGLPTSALPSALTPDLVWSLLMQIIASQVPGPLQVQTTTLDPTLRSQT